MSRGAHFPNSFGLSLRSLVVAYIVMNIQCMKNLKPRGGYVRTGQVCGESPVLNKWNHEAQWNFPILISEAG